MTERVKIDPGIRSELEHHLNTFFAGHGRDVRVLGRGPIENRLPGFHVEVFSPGPRNSGCWTFISISSDSICDHLLFSLPYPFGPALETCELTDGTHIQVLWALPVTGAEKAFKNERGLEELEARFEKAGLEYWDVARKSIV